MEYEAAGGMGACCQWFWTVGAYHENGVNRFLPNVVLYLRTNLHVVTPHKSVCYLVTMKCLYAS